MCLSCVARAAKLEELVARFQVLAREASDPLTMDRLARTAAELGAVAAQLTLSCATCDVEWIDEPKRVAAGG